jgi:ribosomal protein S27E
VKLGELIGAGRLVEVQCQECRASTPLDPSFFLIRRGDIELSRLGERVHCAQCGSSDIDLSAIQSS